MQKCDECHKELNPETDYIYEMRTFPSLNARFPRDPDVGGEEDSSYLFCSEECLAYWALCASDTHHVAEGPGEPLVMTQKGYDLVFDAITDRNESDG